MRVRSVGGAALAAVASGMLWASVAWACVSGPAVTLNPATAKPGADVTLTGTGFRKADPVVVRFNALDGPVLATAPVVRENISATFTVPADAKPGNYVIVATQQAADGSATNIPVRVLLTVVGEGGVPALGPPLVSEEANRPVGLDRTDQVSTGSLALVALGVAGLGMFAAGTASVLAGRRRPVPEVVTTR